MRNKIITALRLRLDVFNMKGLLENKKEECCILRHSSNGWVGYLTNSVLSMVVKVKS